MPDIKMRAASNNDWSFVNLLCAKDLTSYLNSTWPYQPSESEFFKLKRGKFLQKRTTIINYDGIDIGMFSLKQGIEEIVIEEISLWYDTEKNEVACLILDDIIENQLDKGSVAKCFFTSWMSFT